MSFQDSTNELEGISVIMVLPLIYVMEFNFMDLLFLQYSNIVDGEICFYTFQNIQDN